MTIQKVSPGQPWRPSARRDNAVADLINAQPAPRGGGGQRRALPIQPVRIQNNSGADRGQWDVLGVNFASLLVDFTDNSQDAGLDQNFVLMGETPTWPAYIGRWAMLLEEIASGEVGRAVMGGLLAAQIDVLHADHDRADIRYNGGAGDDGKLESGFMGCAEILSRESGTGTDKWAVLRIGPWDSPLLEGDAAALIQTGNSGLVTVKHGTGAQVTAWHNHMAGNSDIADTTEVELYFHRQKGKWSIIEASCA